MQKRHRMWVVGAGWRIGIADSYSAGGKCEEENTKYKIRDSPPP